MRPIDFNDDVAVNPILRPDAAIFSARIARVKLRNGERATFRVFHANFLRRQVFIVLLTGFGINLINLL